ncbi:hypothetical protein [Microbacterium xanthum]|uniref:hypothetical protein n=1 Tax=Microbacterium xanthum TaxID=3079794 RepID=UPI002AD4351F|nr:hypothetical protein [Microbacterium sp. KSW-48]MDZ8171635.1 hypothetical protein [Microbacterium sp. KSW-48]
MSRALSNAQQLGRAGAQNASVSLRGSSSNANTDTRAAQDIAVNPAAPRALGLDRSIGRASHNQALQADIAALPRGVTDIRVNQQQVNALGQRVGINRPARQYTLNGQRYYVEYEGLANPRGALHEARIFANDPNANFSLRIVS